MLLVTLLVAAPAFAQDDEELDTPPGLLARYTAGGETVERVDADVSFVWGETAPDPRLPAGAFEAEWSSLLLLRQEAKYTFHAYVQGEVTIEVDGEVVLQGQGRQPSWVSGPVVPLGFGEKELQIRFRRTAPQARLQVFWSSDAFSPEPLPTYLLFREEPNEELSGIARGRVLFDAHRCNRCHQRADDPAAPPAPALTQVAASYDASALVEKILNPHDAGARMPSFGFTEQEARTIAAFLTKHSRDVALAKPKAVKEKDRAKERRAGEVLFRSVGCLACHRVGEQGKNDPYGGGDLSAIGGKRSQAWLLTWLASPEKLNPDHRMPVFKLADKERQQLALYLASLGKTEEPGGLRPPLAGEIADSMVAEGRRLIEKARCAACHRIDGVSDVSTAGISDLSQLPRDWEQSCLSDTADVSTRRPAYRGIDREALVAYLESTRGPLSRLSRQALGARVLERRNCLGCHERGTGKGMVAIAGRIAASDEALKGQSQGLIPPSLTAVGDKLKDDYLGTAISGEQKTVRLPWLMVRMPKFKHTPEEKAALLEYFVEHDRIPDGLVNLPSSRPSTLNPQPSTLDPQPSTINHRANAGGAEGVQLFGMPRDRRVQAEERGTRHPRLEPGRPRRPDATRILSALDPLARADCAGHGNAVVH